jgi:hypothetical protein
VNNPALSFFSDSPKRITRITPTSGRTLIISLSIRILQTSVKMWGKVSFHRSRKPVIVTPELVKESSVDNVCQSSGSGARTGEKLPKGLPFVPQ